MKNTLILTCLALAFGWATAVQATTINTVLVGNAGNAADTTGFGAVAYNYRIGTTEVTNDQYVDFLNAVATTDTHSLFHTSMNNDTRGGIEQSGSSGSFSYSAKVNMGNKPVNYVSFWDAARFSNWLHNGQLSGAQNNSTTEEGAYTLGGVTNPANSSVSRNAGATWFISSEDEWYKAAYHQPATEGGDSDDYWRYPTASNSAPTTATANSVGDIGNPGANVANYKLRARWNGQNGNVTTVGSAGVDSASFYGTLDQGGNVWEWNEALVSSSSRGGRGGSWNNNAGFSSGVLAASFRDDFFPTNERSFIGFRVATVPEPTSLLLGALASMGLLGLRRRLS